MPESQIREISALRKIGIAGFAGWGVLHFLAVTFLLPVPEAFVGVLLMAAFTSAAASLLWLTDSGMYAYASKRQILRTRCVLAAAAAVLSLLTMVEILAPGVTRELIGLPLAIYRGHGSREHAAQFPLGWRFVDSEKGAH